MTYYINQIKFLTGSSDHIDGHIYGHIYSYNIGCFLSLAILHIMAGDGGWVDSIIRLISIKAEFEAWLSLATTLVQVSSVYLFCPMGVIAPFSQLHFALLATKVFDHISSLNLRRNKFALD